MKNDSTDGQTRRANFTRAHHHRAIVYSSTPPHYGIIRQGNHHTYLPKATLGITKHQVKYSWYVDYNVNNSAIMKNSKHTPSLTGEEGGDREAYIVKQRVIRTYSPN